MEAASLITLSKKDTTKHRSTWQGETNDNMVLIAAIIANNS